MGLLAVALYRNEHDEPKGQCPGCGKVVPLHQALCTRCGTELARETVGGRTTYWCPVEQPS